MIWESARWSLSLDRTDEYRHISILLSSRRSKRPSRVQGQREVRRGSSQVGEGSWCVRGVAFVLQGLSEQGVRFCEGSSWDARLDSRSGDESGVADMARAFAASAFCVYQGDQPCGAFDLSQRSRRQRSEVGTHRGEVRTRPRDVAERWFGLSVDAREPGHTRRGVREGKTHAQGQKQDGPCRLRRDTRTIPGALVLERLRVRAKDYQ